MRPLLASIFLLIAGCMPEKPVEQLAYNCPVITLPPLPPLQTKKITDKTDVGTMAKDYAVDLNRYVGYARIAVVQVNSSNTK